MNPDLIDACEASPLTKRRRTGSPTGNRPGLRDGDRADVRNLQITGHTRHEPGLTPTRTGTPTGKNSHKPDRTGHTGIRPEPVD